MAMAPRRYKGTLDLQLERINVYYNEAGCKSLQLFLCSLNLM